MRKAGSGNVMRGRSSPRTRNNQKNNMKYKN